MEQKEEREVDGIEYKHLYDEAEETWKRLQNSCLVSPSADFAEYSEADVLVVTRETVTQTSILKEIRENLMTHCEEPTEENDDSEEATGAMTKWLQRRPLRSR